LNDLYEGTHNLRKHDYTYKHESYSHENFPDGDWKVISVPYSGKSCQGIVANNKSLLSTILITVLLFPFNPIHSSAPSFSIQHFSVDLNILRIGRIAIGSIAHFVRFWIGIKELIKFEFALESVSNQDILVTVDVSRKKPPSATYEISQKQHDNNQTEHFVNMDHNLLHLSSISSSRVFEVTLYQSFYSTDV